MPSLFSKPLALLVADDVRQLVHDEVPESDTVEFKERLSTKDGSPDAWERGEGRIGDRARNEILDEVIAFANAHGGHVILGVAESDDHPKRAAGITPLRACADFADRLSKAARSSIEPQIPLLDIVGVPMTDDGAGAVVILVGESRLAPHRLQQTLECHRRRGDRTERMTMREIQDLTIERLGSSSRLENQFVERSEAFRAGVTSRSRRPNAGLFAGVRATFLPFDRLQIPRLESRDRMLFSPGPIGATLGQLQLSIDVPVLGFDRRPIVRGLRLVSESSARFQFYREIYSDGRVEFTLYHDPESGQEAQALFGEWVLGVVLQAAIMADDLRSAAGAPGAEYAVEVELYREANPITLDRLGSSRFYNGRTAVVESNPLLLPRLSFGARSEIVQLVDVVAHDIYNAAGVSLGDRHLAFVVPDPRE